VPIPATVITNSPRVAREFESALAAPLIVKPVTGGALTRSFDAAAIAHLEESDGAQPVILQERVFGADLRLTLVDDEVVSAVELGSGDSVDYRGAPDYQSGASLQSFQPDDELCDLARTAARVCDQTLSGVDVKRRKDGSYVVLEANGAPVFAGLEESTGAPISSRVVEWLEANCLGGRES
jgi:glutathione synthase/RimK-type ligase-like ATP-grasp enzyme